jgi:hypothetical protein
VPSLGRSCLLEGIKFILHHRRRGSDSSRCQKGLSLRQGSKRCSPPKPPNRASQTPLLSPVSDSDPGKSTLLTVCSFIIVCEFCERLAYYGMAGSLVLLFQTDLNLTNADADSQVKGGLDPSWVATCRLPHLSMLNKALAMV